jgi:hypothetical protein
VPHPRCPALVEAPGRLSRRVPFARARRPKPTARRRRLPRRCPATVGTRVPRPAPRPPRRQGPKPPRQARRLPDERPQGRRPLRRQGQHACPTASAATSSPPPTSAPKSNSSTSSTTSRSSTCEGEWEALLTENRLIKDISAPLQRPPRRRQILPLPRRHPARRLPRVFVTRNPRGSMRGRIDGDEGRKSLRPLHQRRRPPRSSPGPPARLQVPHLPLDIAENDPKNRHFRPCLLYAIGQCTAPCAEKIAQTHYRDDVDHFVRFLGSKRSAMLRDMPRRCARPPKPSASNVPPLRDQIRAIEKLDERSDRKPGWQPETEVGYIDPAKASQPPAHPRPRPAHPLHRGHRHRPPPRRRNRRQQRSASSTAALQKRIPPLPHPHRRRRQRRLRLHPRGRQPPLPRGRRGPRALPRRHPHRRRPRPAPRRPRSLRSSSMHQAPHGHQPRQEGGTHLHPAANRAHPPRPRKPRPPTLPAIRDEAHRFAQHYHHILRRKRTLDED